MTLRMSHRQSLLVISFLLAAPTVSSQAQSSTCTAASTNPLVMASLCAEKPPSRDSAQNTLTLTVQQVNASILDNPPLIRPGDALIFEANRSDFMLETRLSNGKEILTQPLTEAEAANTSVVWRKARIKLDYPESLNQRIVGLKVTALHQTGTPLLLRDIKIDRQGRFILVLEKSQPGEKPAVPEPPMSYPPDPHVMTASASRPNLWGRQPETGFLAPRLPSFSVRPMMFQSTSTGVPNHYKYNGKELDDETGLYYYGARYLSPALGRFTSPDPKMISKQRLFDPQQWNMYSYSRNNPTSMFDPDGREVTTMLTGKDYKDLVNALAQQYRKESFRLAFKELKNNPMVHEFGKWTTTYTPIAPGSVETTGDPGNTKLIVPRDVNGNVDFIHAHTTINVDLNRTDAPQVEAHEVEHGIQAQQDPARYAETSLKGPGSPEYDARDKQADDFAAKVGAEKPTMSLKDATKEVQKLLPEPKPSQKKEDQK